MNKYICCILFALLLVVSNLAVFANEIKISGMISNELGNPIEAKVVVFQIGGLLLGQQVDESFKSLGLVRSDPITGNYNLVVDNVNIQRLAVAAWYGSPKYYTFREISNFSSDLSSVDFVVPDFSRSDISFKLQILENGVEVNYNKVWFIISVMQTDKRPEGRYVNMSSKYYLITSSKDFYDLPLGDYRIKCRIMKKVAGELVTQDKIVNVTLPLSNPDKIFSINFETL